MTKSYEELVGALGRGVLFRPERRRVRDLLSRDAEPRLLVGGEAYKLFDVSMNGLSFDYPHGQTPWQAGAEVELTLQLYSDSAYHGRARVVRVKPSAATTRVAVALTSGFLDLPDMIRRDEEGRLTRELDGGAEEVHRQVPAAYRDVIARSVHFAQYYRRALGRHEGRLRAVGSGASERLQGLRETAARALGPRWNELEQAASAAALSFLDDAGALRAAKEYTESSLTQLLLGAPMQRRSYLKPLGYPGDYQSMLHIYANGFEGETVFDQVFHKLLTEHPLAHGVRTRKDFVVTLTQAELARTRERGEQTLRVTNLGCGPAREVVDFIARHERWPGEIVWTLIDQEEETLSVAFRDCRRTLAQSGARGELNCLNLSFGQLLSDVSLLSRAPAQDFVYSVGLFDYLREERAQALVLALYERLRPGGLLAIGNALAPNLHFWTPEFLLDWTLLYRTEAEMIRLAARLPSGAEVSVASEPGRAYYFLLVRRH